MFERTMKINRPKATVLEIPLAGRFKHAIEQAAICFIRQRWEETCFQKGLSEPIAN
jgi:hypothetical protein